MYTPYSQNNLLSLVPLESSGKVMAHPPYMIDGELVDVWTNPNLYGFASLLNTHDLNQAYAESMTKHRRPALLLGPHYHPHTFVEQTGVEANCQLDYHSICIQGKFADYLDMLPAVKRRKQVKVIDTESHILRSRTPDIRQTFRDHDTDYPYGKDKDEPDYTVTLSDSFGVRFHPLTSVVYGFPQEEQGFLNRHSNRNSIGDLTYGMFYTVLPHVLSLQDPWLNKVQLMSVYHVPSKRILSLHAVAIQGGVLHSFARYSILQGRMATLALIKAIQQSRDLEHWEFADLALRGVTHLDFTNMALTNKERYKSDFFTGRLRVCSWASPELLNQHLPFIHPL